MVITYNLCNKTHRYTTRQYVS